MPRFTNSTIACTPIPSSTRGAKADFEGVKRRSEDAKTRRKAPDPSFEGAISETRPEGNMATTPNDQGMESSKMVTRKPTQAQINEAKKNRNNVPEGVQIIQTASDSLNHRPNYLAGYLGFNATEGLNTLQSDDDIAAVLKTWLSHSGPRINKWRSFWNFWKEITASDENVDILTQDLPITSQDLWHADLQEKPEFATWCNIAFKILQLNKTPFMQSHRADQYALGYSHENWSRVINFMSYYGRQGIKGQSMSKSPAIRPEYLFDYGKDNGFGDVSGASGGSDTNISAFQPMVEVDDDNSTEMRRTTLARSPVLQPQRLHGFGYDYDVNSGLLPELPTKTDIAGWSRSKKAQFVLELERYVEMVKETRPDPLAENDEGRFMGTRRNEASDMWEDEDEMFDDRSTPYTRGISGGLLPKVWQARDIVYGTPQIQYEGREYGQPEAMSASEPNIKLEEQATYDDDVDEDMRYYWQPGDDDGSIEVHHQRPSPEL